MSTVAYRAGVMACDTQTTNGSEFQNGFFKMGQTRRYLFGWAGRLGSIYPVFDWLLDVESEPYGDDPTQFYKDSSNCLAEIDCGVGIIANERGDLWSFGPDGIVAPQPRKFDAIGSGGAYAVGAMMFGASAVDAVGVATRCDTGTSGTTMSLVFRTTRIVRPHLIVP